jgi:hypothetical protein
MVAANGSTIVARLSCHVTPAISARDATFTPSSRLERTRECLRRGMKGPVMATKTKAGKKISTVAASAPGAPSRRYPIKVVVVKTRPGVTCPTATAVADFYGPDHYGSIGGVVGMFVTAARMLAPVGAGAMSVTLGGYAPVLWTLAFGSALAAVAMFMAQRIVPPRRSEPAMKEGH